MKLPGLITIQPDQPDLIARAARVLGESFLEEPWFRVWLSALDERGTTDQRKREILVEAFTGEFAVHAPFQAVYATEDFAAVAGAYLASEFAGQNHADLEAKGLEQGLAGLLTAEEAAALDAQEKAMEAISDFSWAAGHAQGRDHIYFFGWAVDASKRGSGAFRRLVTPFFDYADEHELSCYLECYSDKLQSLYEHVGFEVVNVLADPAFDITERCMVRAPR